MKPESLDGREPRLLLEEYFHGRTKAWGIFEDRFGGLRRQFKVEIDGSWDGRTLVLNESFAYDDGRTERRIWRIRSTGAHWYEAEADGVIGTARAWAYGNAVRWRYLLALPIGDRVVNVHFDDWMFLQDDGVMISRAKVTKLGVRLGSVTLAFRRA